MPYFIYVLRSEKNDKLYVGSTAKDPRQRLLEHNNGQNKWTSVNRPFKLITKVLAGYLFVLPIFFISAKLFL